MLFWEYLFSDMIFKATKMLKICYILQKSPLSDASKIFVHPSETRQNVLPPTSATRPKMFASLIIIIIDNKMKSAKKYLNLHPPKRGPCGPGGF